MTIIASLGFASLASAQHQVCPNPPCGPGYGFTDPNTQQANVVCKNWNAMNCMVVTVVGGTKLSTPNELKPGDSGQLEVKGEDGGTKKYAFTNYQKSFVNTDGVVYQFGSLKQE